MLEVKVIYDNTVCEHFLIHGDNDEDQAILLVKDYIRKNEAYCGIELCELDSLEPEYEGDIDIRREMGIDDVINIESIAKLMIYIGK